MALKPNQLQWKGHLWRIYNGTGGLGQEWQLDHVLVDSQDRVVILNANGVAGGIAMLNEDKVYGSWVVRFKMSKGTGSKYAILLWPDSGNRPEIDFAEDTKTDPLRQIVTATLHPDMVPRNMIHRRTKGDFSVFHDLGVTWTKSKLSFTLDGKEWASITDKVPNDPHHLAIQTNHFNPSGPATRLTVANVTIK